MKLAASELCAADSFIDHLCARIDHYTTKGDPLRDRYIGFCAVTSATHLETVLKVVTLNFCHTQNRYLHSVMENELRRFNGRIGYQELRTQLKRFDSTCDKHFVRITTRWNRRTLRTGRTTPDLIRSYDSLLQIRHSFVHNLNTTFAQITTAELRGYIESGKQVASAFARSLRHR